MKTSVISEPGRGRGGKPPWLRVRMPQGAECSRLRSLLKECDLHTVCEEALCPNMGECWRHGRATLMILGEKCSRSCRFCNVQTERTGVCDKDDPARVAGAVSRMGLKDVVITSVTRDDLPDGGSAVWADTILKIREAVPGILLEILVPDFAGNLDALDRVIATRPDVFGHNLETVASLYSRVRPQADYGRSLEVLSRARAGGLIVKTGLMVGLGETREEVHKLMADALGTGCEILTVGQYLQPSRRNLPVARHVEPAEFDEYREHGLSLGFAVVISAPLVRSSYHSDEQDAFVRRRLRRR